MQKSSRPQRMASHARSSVGLGCGSHAASRARSSYRPTSRADAARRRETVASDDSGGDIVRNRSTKHPLAPDQRPSPSVDRVCYPRHSSVGHVGDERRGRVLRWVGGYLNSGQRRALAPRSGGAPTDVVKTKTAEAQKLWLWRPKAQPPVAFQHPLKSVAQRVTLAVW